MRSPTRFDLASPLPASGVAAPLYASFTGHKRVPLWAVGTNSYRPVLRFFETEIELKVIKTHRRFYSDIESVDAMLWWKTNNLTLNFAGTPWNFTANLTAPRYLSETLRFLNAKGVVLSARARDILESAPR